MVFSASYKDRPAVGVSTGRMTTLFLPLDGAKMASLKGADGCEWLAQAPGDAYRALSPEGSYVDSECSGFDDMFPTIDPYVPESGEYRGIEYPDHGEMCRLPSECEMAGDRVVFTTHSRRFRVTMVKRVSALPDGSLELLYRLTNRGREPFPYVWAAHLMLRGIDGARVVTPFAPGAPIRMMFGPPGCDGLPRDQLTGHAPEGGAYKFYYLDRIPEGWCGLSDERRGQALVLSYDHKKLPYLGVWLNNGSFKGMYNVALEPCTTPFDRPDARMSALEPGSEQEFAIRFTLND